MKRVFCLTELYRDEDDLLTIAKVEASVIPTFDTSTRRNSVTTNNNVVNLRKTVF
jgi:hypothetical protein